MTNSITTAHLLPAIVQRVDTAPMTPNVPQRAEQPRRVGYENANSSNALALVDKLGGNSRGGLVDVYV